MKLKSVGCCKGNSEKRCQRDDMTLQELKFVFCSVLSCLLNKLYSFSSQKNAKFISYFIQLRTDLS